MSFIELVPAVKELERADKFRLMQFLLLELAREEDAAVNSRRRVSYTPLNAFEAGDTLLNLLAQHNQIPA